MSFSLCAMMQTSVTTNSKKDDMGGALYMNTQGTHLRLVLDAQNTRGATPPYFLDL